MSKVFLRLGAVKQRTGLATSSIYEKMKLDPTFPRPVKTGPKRVAWVDDEITAWQEACIAARDAEAAKRSA